MSLIITVSATKRQGDEYKKWAVFLEDEFAACGIGAYLAEGESEDEAIDKARDVLEKLAAECYVRRERGENKNPARGGKKK